MRVFFELNGQPRTVRVPNRKAQATAPKRPKAEVGNPSHVAAPMPGVIASVAVAGGQPVQAGDLMLTIEAMKMETGLYADRAGHGEGAARPAGRAGRRQGPAGGAGAGLTAPGRCRASSTCGPGGRSGAPTARRRVPVAPLRRDARTDVLVVGMGVSGAMIAEALTAAGHAVMLIDRRGPILGSTAATTALVQFEIDTPLSRLAPHDRPGPGRARLAAVAARGRQPRGADRRARDRAAALRARRSLYLAGDVLDADGLADEAAARRAAGLHGELPRRAAALRDEYGLDARRGDRQPRQPRARSAQADLGPAARGARARRAALRAGRGDRRSSTPPTASRSRPPAGR